MKVQSGRIVFSPSDLVRYLASPFASWMDRFYLENPRAITPDEPSDDERLIAETGNRHEQTVLADMKASGANIVEIRRNAADPKADTIAAIKARAPVIYQAALEDGRFAGFADFLILDPASGGYQVWDTKLALAPKPYYAIQLCCYSEMLVLTGVGPMPERFGIILGSREGVEFRVEDFIHYYRRVKAGFLQLQQGFTGTLADRPEPLPRAEHGRWTSHAERFFRESDHLVQVAGISRGQIKRLSAAGIATMAGLAEARGRAVPRLAVESLDKLVAQAQLQCETRDDRSKKPDAPPRYEVLPGIGPNGERLGLATLPPADPDDVYFDMEGFPLAEGGLEYLFGVCTKDAESDGFEFRDWWAHDRAGEKLAFEGFVDWVYAHWKSHPGMHIYHYAAYEVSAVRRLSTRHDSRQDLVDELLRNEVFVDLYRVVLRGLRIGEEGYSIKQVEHLYRPARVTEVATAAGSVVQYARWIESGQPGDWRASPLLRSIRDYNEDDCRSTGELHAWLLGLAAKVLRDGPPPAGASEPVPAPVLSPETLERIATGEKLRQQGDAVALVLADLLEFHRREGKPVWWRHFDRLAASPEELADDPGCIEGVQAVGSRKVDKRSLIQSYTFNPDQECRIAEGDRGRFTHNPDASFAVDAINASTGALILKIGEKALAKMGGDFPRQGSLLQDDYVSPAGIPDALAQVAAQHLTGNLHPPVAALLKRVPPSPTVQGASESTADAAVRIAGGMAGGCLVIQGPPGTGKTYTASYVISSLLAAGKRIGVASNSHKAILNLLGACGAMERLAGRTLRGIKVGGGREEAFFNDNPEMEYVESGKDTLNAYGGGIAGGTAWLFSRPEWEQTLDFLFIDEAGQVPLANSIAMARCARNLVLLGDQMQLEQPVQGAHPGDAGLSVLQYALKDQTASREDAPVFHAVVPANQGLFLGESRRMHPSVCQFISDSIYDGRLKAHPDCARQEIAVRGGPGQLIDRGSGIVFSPVEHEGNVQRSAEEVERIKIIYQELLGSTFTGSDGRRRPLTLQDFLFIAPYNAQVRALKDALPEGARVGSVDKFQGQEAPVCILSFCSSYGEYGSRGLAFILDRNRVNVAISRAKCLAVVVGDPRIATAAAGSLEEMKLINLFCKLLGE